MKNPFLERMLAQKDAHAEPATPGVRVAGTRVSFRRSSIPDALAAYTAAQRAAQFARPAEAADAPEQRDAEHAPSERPTVGGKRPRKSVAPSRTPQTGPAATSTTPAARSTTPAARRPARPGMQALREIRKLQGEKQKPVIPKLSFSRLVRIPRHKP